MHRRSFIKTGAFLALANSIPMSALSALRHIEQYTKPTEKMPVLFIGHGNPMNAIEDNAYSRRWKELGKTLPKPQVILSVSAHWLTKGLMVTAMDKPNTIHDFSGFPKSLADFQYPAPGAPIAAAEVQQLITKDKVELDDAWGLDHGTWSVLANMYPEANVPVFQLSIDYGKPLSYHYEVGKQLSRLRDKGVLIIGSGNLVHNLRAINWNGDDKIYDWALEFDTKFKNWIDEGDHASMLNYQKILGNTAQMAHPTNDHLLPLYYTLGLQGKNDTVSYFNEQFDMASISMRSLIIKDKG